MRLALAQAQQAELDDEVPIGAVLVKDNDVLAAAYNQTLTQSDPSAHAEILVLRQAGAQLQSPRLIGTTLYVTIEPCAMCVGALIQARIQRLVYGAREPKTGAVVSAFDLLMSEHHNHRVNITEGVLADECLEPMQRFFSARR